MIASFATKTSCGAFGGGAASASIPRDTIPATSAIDIAEPKIIVLLVSGYGMIRSYLRHGY